MKRLMTVLVVLVACSAANAGDKLSIDVLRFSTMTTDVRALLNVEQFQFGLAVADNGDSVGFQVLAHLLPKDKSPIIPYFTMGLGQNRTTDDSEQADNTLDGNLGIGVKANLTDNIGLIAEYRALSQTIGPGLGVGLSITF